MLVCYVRAWIDDVWLDLIATGLTTIRNSKVCICLEPFGSIQHKARLHSETSQKSQGGRAAGDHTLQWDCEELSLVACTEAKFMA